MAPASRNPNNCHKPVLFVQHGAVMATEPDLTALVSRNTRAN